MNKDDMQEGTKINADSGVGNGLKVSGIKSTDCNRGDKNTIKDGNKDFSDDHNDDDDRARGGQGSGSENSDSEEVQSLKDEYGRPLSAYEIMRLERIKRNQAYLAKLGLESDATSGKKGTLLSRHEEEMRKKKASRQRKSEIFVERRTSVGRRSKAKKVDYTDKSMKWKADVEPKEKKSKAENPKVGEKHKRVDSLPLFIYREFNNMRVTRRQNVKTTEKLLRLAEIEYRIANRELEIAQRKERRFRERETRDVLLPIVRDVERRRVDIIKALKKIDEGRKKRPNPVDLKKEMAKKVDEANTKFPEAVHEALRSLGKMMFDRVPESERLGRGKESTKKKKAGLQGNDGELSDEASEGNKEKATLPLNIDLDELRKIEQSEKVRVQRMRNVGGPVTEKLAKAVQRKWLEGDGPVGACFNEYVPQAGDTVLYYPCAHYDFLRYHPDIRGKKGRLALRKTLWERAIDEKKMQEEAKGNQECVENDDGSTSKKEVEKPWWTMEWISSIQHGAGRYPILCKVEKAVAEFPYDQASQTEIRRLHYDVKRSNHGNESKRKRNKDDGRQKPSKMKPHMCLAVTLRPLAPISPPKEANHEEVLSPPPLFSVLIFPSEKNPFLVPFSLAFRTSMVVSSEDHVKVADSYGVFQKAKVLTLEEELSEMRQNLIISFQSIFNEFASIDMSAVHKLDSFISEAYSKHGNCHMIPEGDLRAVIQTILYHYHTRNGLMNLQKEVEQLKSSKHSNLGVIDMACSLLTNLSHLIRRSLPKWESVVVEMDGSKEIKRACPWQLTFADDLSLGDDINAALAPSVLFSANRVVSGGYVHLIHEALRSKLESAIKYLIENENTMFNFVAPVNVSLVPDYTRFVPIPTCFRKILRRLKRQTLKYPKASWKSGEDILEDRGYGDSQCCFYRSIDALLSDISDIFQNCLLYNAPDSDIVLAAFHATKLLKLVVQKIAENYHKDEDAKRKMEAEQLINADLAAKGEVMLAYSKKTSIPPSQVEEFGHIYNGTLQRSWLEDVETCERWLPQCGDMVIYNRVQHGIFVNGHINDLSIRQRTLPSMLPPSAKMVKTIAPRSLENGGNDLSQGYQYFIGTVVWIRVVFPGSETIGRSDSSPLFAIGIRFHYKWLSKSIQVVYWKPCTNDNGAERTDEGTCKSCGLHKNQSFLTPAWEGPLDKVLPPFPLSLISSSSTLPLEISTEYAKRVDKCLERLKERLIRSVPIDNFQPHGYFLDECFHKYSEIPHKFQHIFEEDDNDLIGPDAKDSSLNVPVILSRKYYVEPWAFADDGSKKSKINTRATKSCIQPFAELIVPFHETCIANPNLSLNAIQQRVNNGFYRGRDGIINDIREACATCITYMIKERTRTKLLSSNSEFAILKAAIQSCGVDLNYSQEIQNKEKGLLIPNSEPRVTEVQSNPEAAISIKNLSHQEREILSEIQDIFKLHAIALVIVLETAAAEVALGVEPSQFHDKCGPPRFEQELARKNLNLMLTSIGTDKMKFRKPIPAGGDPPKVTVKINIKKTEDTSASVSTNNSIDFSKPIILDREIYESSPRLKRVLKVPPRDSRPDIHIFVKCMGTQMTKSNPIILHPGHYLKQCGDSNVFDSFRKDGLLSQIKVILMSEQVDLNEIGRRIDCNPGSSVGKRMESVETKSQEVEGKIVMDRQSDSDEDDSFTNKLFTFLPSDYLNNPNLIRALFCRSNRRHICLKCVLGKKGLLTCRVRYAHSNHDPTWIEYYRSQGGIDAILTILDPSHKAPPELSLSQDIADDQDDLGSEAGSESKSQAQTEASTNEEDIAASLDVASATQKEAEAALNLARELLTKAEKEIQSPLVLSTEFMHANFDVDPEDGHFEICPKCGLGGDVICCESCPMVSHPKCEEMTEIPDEDWHCYYCVSRMTKNEVKSKESKPVMLKKVSRFRSRLQENLELEESSAEDDFHNTIEHLANTLERLKQSRQKPQTITLGSKLVKEFDGLDYIGDVIELASDDCEFYKVRYEDNDEEELTLEELQACMAAYSKMQKSNDTKPIVAPVEVKRKRGRPRKNAVETTVVRKRGRPPKNKPHKSRTNESSRNSNELKGINKDLQPRRRGRPPKRLKIDKFENELLDRSDKDKGTSPALQSQVSVDFATQSPKRKRGRPRKYPIPETLESSDSGKGYSSKRMKTLSSEPVIPPENIPTPGHVDKNMSYYCTLENDTSAKIAAIIGCKSWLDVAYIPENLERFPALQDKKIKFKRGTLVRIAECKFSKKKAAALIE